jgi:hypothetical protein
MATATLLEVKATLSEVDVVVSFAAHVELGVTTMAKLPVLEAKLRIAKLLVGEGLKPFPNCRSRVPPSATELVLMI